MKRQRHRRDEYEYRRLGGKYSDESNDDDEVELHPRTTYKEPPTVEKVVEEGDTLQSLAIRYGCSVAELKRLNHILNDNEIYAKGVVKVPERPFSVILAGVHSSGRSSPNGKTPKKTDENLDLLEDKLNNSIILSPLPSTSKSENFNEVIFNSTLASKPNDLEHEDNEIQLEEEEITLLPKPSYDPTPEVVSKLTCSGTGNDIHWVELIVLMVIVIIAVPVIIFFYIFEHPEQYHHHNSHNSSHSS